MASAGDVEEQKPEAVIAAPADSTKPGLLQKAATASGVSSLAAKSKSKYTSFAEEVGIVDTHDAAERTVSYNSSALGTWETFTFVRGTILKNKLLWGVLNYLLILSLAIAIITIFTCVDPAAVDTSRFEIISDFLKVFVGFLLGFFLTSSVNRWSDSVGGFLKLCDATRNMMMQLLALGVSEEKCKLVDRYGLLSAQFLVMELENRCLADEDAKVQRRDAVFKTLIDSGSLKEEEAVTLRQVTEYSSMMWVWIGSRLGRLAADGDVPHMASPTYARLMTLAEGAQGGIRKVHVSAKVQMPFLYVHCLALLVHLNNVLSSIRFGLTLGVTIAKVLSAYGIHIYGARMLTNDTKGNIPQDLQNLLTSFITCIFAPLMYQGFLQIGLVLSQPFDKSFGANLGSIPTARFIAELQKDLRHGMLMSREVHGWEKPSFKK